MVGVFSRAGLALLFLAVCAASAGAQLELNPAGEGESGEPAKLQPAESVELAPTEEENGASSEDASEGESDKPQGEQTAPAQLEPTPAKPLASGTADKLRAAYSQSQKADSIEDYTSLLESLERIAAEDLPEQHAAYVKKLTGWAANRRGEAYAEKAGELAAEGREQEAIELDAQALADFEMAVEHDPEKWKAVHNRGVSYALAGDYEKALADMTRTIELKPDFANAHFNRGEIYYEEGDYEQAAEDYSESLRINPRDAGAYTSRGHAYYHLGKHQQAVSDYSQAVQIDSDNAEYYANRADAYRSLRRWAEAARDYRQAIRLDNESARAYQGAAWMMATSPDSRYRNTRLALQSAQRAVQLAGDAADYRYLDTLAAAQANAGQYSAAANTLGQAIELAPAEAQSTLERRLALYRGRRAYRQGMFEGQTRR